MFKSKITPSIEDVKHLQIPLQDISLATNGFAKENLIGNGGFVSVYKGISEKHGCIAVKRLERGQGPEQGDHEFKTEIALLSKYKHENIVSLLGFCDEDGEKLLVYRYESNGSLDKQINNKDLTWIQRLHICLDVARGLKYLHEDVGTQHRILHRDVKSANILLDENRKAKIADFGLARVGPANTKSTFGISKVCGTPGYIDPDYFINNYLTQKSDVYSFGVVLWEILCVRLEHVIDKDERVVLSQLVKRHYTSKTIDTIILSSLQTQINAASLLTFSNIAYQCLENVEKRPKMKEVMEQLHKALHNQLEVKKGEVEGKPTKGDERKGADSKDSPPSRLRQEIVLSTFMHCEDCAREVRRCLKGFEGVEGVVTDCETHKVFVKGEKADPLKVLQRVKKNNNRRVELLSPVPKPPAKLEPKGPSKREEKEVKNMEEGEIAVQEAKPAVEDEEMVESSKELLPPPLSQDIVLNVFMHCENCAKKVRRCLKGFEGVEDVLTDCETHKVVVKGKKANPLMVLERVKKKCHRKVELISPVTDEPKKTGQEKPRKQGWKFC